MRETVMPAREGCTSDDAWVSIGSLFRKEKRRLHQWNHKTFWNGNSKAVLPFESRTSGIPRSGWRCYHCGKFVWDESDAIFALKYAYHRGLLPDFADLMVGGDIKIQYQSVENHDAAVDLSCQRKHIKQLRKGH